MGKALGTPASPVWLEMRLLQEAGMIRGSVRRYSDLVLYEREAQKWT
jgi:hypothetical protein